MHTASCLYKLLHLQSPHQKAGPRVHACWRTHPPMMQHLSWDFVSGGASWPCGFSTCSWHIRLAFGPPRILGFAFNLSSGGILSEGLGGGLLRKKTRCDDGCPKKNAERSKEHMCTQPRARIIYYTYSLQIQMQVHVCMRAGKHTRRWCSTCPETLSLEEPLGHVAFQLAPGTFGWHLAPQESLVLHLTCQVEAFYLKVWWVIARIA